MDRRNFMKSMGCAGALIATSQLPVWGEDRPQEFPKRGQFERLSLSCATVEVGLDVPFSVLHISDTHLTAAYAHEDEKKQTLHRIRTTTFGGRQEEALRDSLDWAKAHNDYVVHTGDLIDWQSQANLDLVKKYFGPHFICALGNHEFSPDMWLSEPKETRQEAFKNRTREMLEKTFVFDTRFHSQIAGGVNFITLDNVYGTVTQEQVERFEAEVLKGFPIVLCMHVPFFSDRMWRTNMLYWAKKPSHIKSASLPAPTGDYKAQLTDPTTSRFIERLRQEPLLKAILAGHIHISMQEPFSATATQFTVAGNFLFHGQEIIFI